MYIKQIVDKAGLINATPTVACMMSYTQSSFSARMSKITT